MQKMFNEAAEMVLDEGFIAWYRKIPGKRAEEWISWMEENPSAAEMVEEAVQLLDAIRLEEKPVPELQVRRSLQALQQRLEEEKPGTTQVVAIAGWRRWWWVAAIFIVMAGTGTMLFFNNRPGSAIAAGYGELVRQELPDGSVVMLNANSNIRLGKGFSAEKEREVWLKGEAFFEVAKTSDMKRFVVHTDRFDIVVTGTQFNVVNRGEKTSILLTEGKVHLKLTDGSIIDMKPGEYVELDGNSEAEKKTMPQDKVLAWKERKLIFENTSLQEAVSQIVDLYGVKITIADSAASAAPITGILPNDNLDVLLAALEAATGLKVVERQEGKIILGKPDK